MVGVEKSVVEEVGEEMVLEEGKLSEVVEEGDSGLSSLTTSTLHLLLPLWPRMASMEKLERLLFSPILAASLLVLNW